MIKNLISFIIIEYHSIDDVLACIQSLNKNCSDLKHEVIVSSNSQYEIGKQEFLIKSHTAIKWCFNEKNGGFAYGMNKGILASNGEYIVLQNPDTRLENNKLSEALTFLKNNPSVGIVGPKILNQLGETQDSCRPFVTPGDILSRFIIRIFRGRNTILESKFNYNELQKVNWIIGAFMITSKTKIDKVGLLNDKFFMYVEDMDWCFRFWENGFKVVYYPNLKVAYEGDRKSTGSKKKYFPISLNKYTFYHIKNYILFLLNHGYFKIKRMQKV